MGVPVTDHIIASAVGEGPRHLWIVIHRDSDSSHIEFSKSSMQLDRWKLGSDLTNQFDVPLIIAPDNMNRTFPRSFTQMPDDEWRTKIAAMNHRFCSFHSLQSLVKPPDIVMSVGEDSNFHTGTPFQVAPTNILNIEETEMKPVNQELRRSRVRRKDREVKEEGWIREFLHKASFGVLGTSSTNQPFLTSLIFVFDEAGHAIYLHSALRGRTRSNLEANPKVCFTVSEIGRFLPSDVALEFSVEYASVVVFGNCSIVNSRQEARLALQMHLDKYFPHLREGHDYRSITEEEVCKTSVFKITIEEWSAKRKSEESDFPGAFRYGFSGD